MFAKYHYRMCGSNFRSKVGCSNMKINTSALRYAKLKRNHLHCFFLHLDYALSERQYEFEWTYNHGWHDFKITFGNIANLKLTFYKWLWAWNGKKEQQSFFNVWITLFLFSVSILNFPVNRNKLTQKSVLLKQNNQNFDR